MTRKNINAVITDNKHTIINFENTEIAFQNKSNKDLNRAYWLFKMMSSTALINIGSPLSKFAFKVGLPIESLIRKTIYKQFCGGESIDGCRNAIQELAESQVSTILDYSVEGEGSEESFNNTSAEIIRTINFAKTNTNITFSVFKPTGIGRLDLLAKVSSGSELNNAEVEEFNRYKSRFEAICRTAYESNIKILIDAEHSWIQDTVDDSAREMMEKYNNESPTVYNTYQLYRHDKLASLRADFDYANVRGFHLGAKIVRGAYMEIEHERAAKKGYRSPIQNSKKASDKDFDLALIFCLDNIEKIGFMAGTHNEESCRLLVDEISKRGLISAHPNIYFAQLLGMSDNLSFNLSAAGYNVGKYMPYGPVESVMPYLIRRAQENTSVGGQTTRELTLILKEKERRKTKR